MFSDIFMKLLERRPEIYDARFGAWTLGASDRARDAIVGEVRPGDRVLDLGCGTGGLAAACARKGAFVLGVDRSRAMLGVAAAAARRVGAEERVELREMSVAALDDEVEEASFDVVAAAFLFSELAEPEQEFVLDQARRALRPGGIFAAADEFASEARLHRALYAAVRLPLVLAALVVGGSSTRPVDRIEEKLARAGLSIKRRVRCGTAIAVVFARKPSERGRRG